MAAVPSPPERAVTDAIPLSRPSRHQELATGMLLSERPISETDVHVLLDGVLTIELDGTAITEVGPGAIFDPSRRAAESKEQVTVRARTNCRLASVEREALDETVATEQKAGAIGGKEATGGNFDGVAVLANHGDTAQ